jgi:hypothetical protein
MDASGKGAQAIEAYQKYLRLRSSGPLAAKACYRVACLHREAGDFEAAIVWYERVLSDHPGTDEETHSLLDLAALYREDVKNSAKSMEYSQRAFVRYMDNGKIQGAAQELVEAQYRTALAFYEKKDYKKAGDTAGAIFQTYPSGFVPVETRAKVDALSDRSRRADLLSRSSVDLVFLRKEEVFNKALEQDFGPIHGPGDRIPSPDGKFVVDRKRAPNGTIHLYLAQVPEKGDKLVFKILKPTFGAGIPSWSPDGKDLIYVRSTGNRKKLERTSIKTKATQTLYWTEGRDLLGTSTAYHPSGSMIAYVYAGKVWVMNPNGIKSWLKSKETLSYTAGLAWSKDGTMIRYWDLKPGQKNRVENILVLDANTIPKID